jgi:DNA-binding NarL/FixJ family response regulator
MDTPKAGIQATKAILQALPETKIVVLTVHKNNELILEAFAAGAVDYVIKNTSPNDLTECVKGAFSNTSLIKPEISRVLRDEFKRIKRDEESFLEHVNRLFRLSRTELEILELFVHGMSRREISEVRIVEEVTVKTQVRSILRKTEFQTVRDLVRTINALDLSSFIHDLLRQ